MSIRCFQCENPIVMGTTFCTQCGASIPNKTSSARKEKQKRASAHEKHLPHKKGPFKLFIVAATILLVAGWFYVSLPKKTNRTMDGQPIIAAETGYPKAGQNPFNIQAGFHEDKLFVSLDVIKAKKFVSFLFPDSLNNVPLLAYISNEGRLVTAVAICEPCKSNRFHIEGEELVCNVCGTSWKLNSLEAVRGACAEYPPALLPSTIVGNEIQIDRALVDNWHPRI